MTAVLLGKLGYKVTVFEKRNDFSDSGSISSEFGASTSAVKRSINLALSYRGMAALAEVGLLDDAMKDAIRMPGRVIHSKDGGVVKQAYGKADEAIWSVGRQTLNLMLLRKAASAGPNVQFHFGRSLSSVDAVTGSCVFESTSTGSLENYTFDLIIGSDGAFSAVREQMLRQGRVSFSRSYIAHGYKELTIPPVQSPGSSQPEYALKDFEGLHIWPRGQFMLIALPNPDKSFTATLFAPWRGEDGFDSVDANDGQAVVSHFKRHFPDVLPLMPDLAEDYRQNPVGSLQTVRTDPWQLGRVVLLGDAAHAIVPFFGQGMNAAFQDALMLYQIIKKRQEDAAAADTAKSSSSSVVDLVDLVDAAAEFARIRTPAANSLADLSLDHYHDMASNTASTFYLLQKKVEAGLHFLFPKLFLPMYSMVAFSDVPYHEAVARSRRQDDAINKIIAVNFGLFCIGSYFFGKRFISSTVH
jgi:kynurenine 3-monooxygenase